ncbi:MAG: A/G-specific adenine glycosylase [Bacteroidetes bacterium]|nr:A/G-specific adenine glycosylase [Bacteroidota bacterium]MBS1973029.1 A/G-specific adenine glycosylase [Bacteroidota bacterium]
MEAGFSKKLLQWDKQENKRDMPWKREIDPYKIWLSEIILQQTRVEQGWSYYEKFIKAFPTINHLAKAPSKKVFKLWEGLGYYNRCKNLIDTAKIISKTRKGKFPETYNEIRELKGIGPYTAAAIASFAYNLPYAVVDGNVERILSRYFAISAPVDSTEGKKLYADLAAALLDKKKPSAYNQAIMDFGAVICKPKNPLCQQCPQLEDCQAYQNNLVSALPVKAKKKFKKERWLYYFIIRTGNNVYISQRTEKDIWQNLYQFVLLESKKPLQKIEISESSFIKDIFRGEDISTEKISELYRWQLTHQTIHVRFIHVAIPSPILIKEYFLVKMSDLKKYPFPKPITAYLDRL